MKNMNPIRYASEMQNASNENHIHHWNQFINNAFNAVMISIVIQNQILWENEGKTHI